jgi:hypothetical protein
MAYIVFFGMFWSIYVLRTKGMQATFLRVWIPLFLSMPTSFWVNIPSLPDPNFMQAAILPMLALLVLAIGPSLTQLGRMEILIITYMLIRVIADYLSRGYSDAQNYAFYVLSALIGPFLLGRYVIDSRRMDIATARAIVGMFLLFFPMFLWELKAWVSPIYKVLSPFFPNAFSGLSIRWGIARTAGTFEHPILACIMVTAAYRLHRWLTWNGQWSGKQQGIFGWWQSRTQKLRIPLETQISIALIFMALMTISRGPWIGGFAAAAVVAAGNLKNRKKGLLMAVAILGVGAVTAKFALDAYTTPAVGEALSGEAQTMVYRKEMIERYKEYLFQKPFQGWGLTTVPKIAGMESVDNAFFLMALQHGLFAPIVFALIFTYAILSQLKFALKAPVGHSPIGFTFAGIYLMCFISFMTVYMGAQTEPLLFLMLGWGESIKRRPHIEGKHNAGAPAQNLNASPFKRILV